jgi:AcrR family transcriptional regulator
MPPDVKRNRNYNAAGRQEHALANRRAVLAAAHRLFLERGYAGTTMAAVAKAAGVSSETVYKAFENKPGLVKAVFDVAIVGDDEAIPMLQRAFVARNRAEPDPRRRLLAYGEHLAAVNARAAPVQLVVRDAAVSDTGAAAVWNQVQHERLIGMTAFAEDLASHGHLRSDVTSDEARDVLWTHNSVELWDLLVNGRGWTNERLGNWVARQLIAALL